MSDQERAEHDHDPVVLHQHGAERDEQRAEDQRAEDAVEQHAVLVPGRHREVREHRDEHEDVVDGERLLDDVAGEELERGIAGELRVVEPGERRHLRQVPEHVAVEQVVEGEREQHPDDAPGGGLARADLVRLAVEHAEVEREHAAARTR